MWFSIADSDLTRAEVKRIEELREARSKARKDARSGHPGRRALGRRAIALATVLIEKTYRQAATR